MPTPTPDYAAASLLERMREQRMFWHEVAPGKRVRFRRPLEAEMHKLAGGRITPEHVVEFAVDWSGFTEADLLGGSIGSADEVPFASSVWGEWVLDNAAVCAACSAALASAIERHIEQRRGEQGNS